MTLPTPDPRQEFATDVVRRLRAGGYTALWAGGCVRDLLMGRLPQDYDVATDARPDAVRDIFGRRRTLAVGESFGVIIVLGPREAGQVEVATFRTEGPYRDGRRPESVRFATPEEDAQRRDFTINGMFFDPLAQHVLDFVGGEADIQRGILRAIGEPRDRMTEDKLRMLRAVRFAAALDFELDEATARAVREMSSEISVVSPERISQELRKMLANRHRRRSVRLLQQLDLLTVIIPELAPVTAAQEPANWLHTLDLLEQLAETTFEVATAALLHTVPSPLGELKRNGDAGTVRAICRRLRLSNEETDRICWLTAHQHALDDAPTQTLAALKRLLSQEGAADLVHMQQSSCRAAHRPPEAVDFVESFLADTPPEVLNPPHLITGDDLKAMGLRPGPPFKTLLDEVRDAQLNGEITTREQARAWAKRLMD